jgi:diguanylate cyclase (GGDEF)-like protein
MRNNRNKKFEEQAIEVAPRIWWVGHVSKEDSLQCHPYLIEQGDQSVLIDPGSLLTFPDTLKKIEQVIPFDQIRYFICQHQDPDIAASLPLINERVTRDDCAIVCHSRAAVLLKHYRVDLPFVHIGDLNWSLPLSDRNLKFVFTPYVHFPGAFCSFDEKSGSLFSSDLFGGFTDDFTLYAENEDYFESLRPFHEHYMPSNAILQHALKRINTLPITQIMPQHGSIIPQELVQIMISRLMEIDCGLFLHEDTMAEVIQLSEINRTLRDINDVMVLSKNFHAIAAGLLEIAQRFLPATSIEFYSTFEKDQFLHLSPGNRFRGKITLPPPHLKEMISISMEEWRSRQTMDADSSSLTIQERGQSPCLILPLSGDDLNITGIAIIHLSETLTPEFGIDRIISRLQSPLQVAVERETIYQAMDMERQQIYDRASRDPLTNLYTRFYMQDTVQRILDLQERDRNSSVNLAMIDIDFFKRINDTYGHNAGDMVLQKISAVVLKEVRSSDLPIRLGGEEFGVFLMGTTQEKAKNFSERLRQKIEQLNFPQPLDKETVTISIGLAEGKKDETLEDFIERADRALYKAKNQGRNQVQHAEN